MTITLTQVTPDSTFHGIIESEAYGITILSPAQGRTQCRILYVDNYGGKKVWERIKKGDMPPQHVRGCLDLVRLGHEVALAEPIPDFYLYRRPLPHDLRLYRIIREWLGSDGVLFCGHNVLFWLLLLRKLRVISCRIVSNLWAREPLNFARFHSGILGLTRAGYEQARLLAPKLKVAPLGWGADLSVYPQLPYNPEIFFSCGIALRDFKTLSLAAAKTRHALHIVCPGEVPGVTWPANVTAINSGKGWNFEAKRLTYAELLQKYYARSAASLIILTQDDAQYTAIGFTEIVEAMAMARPIILTRTGALPTEIDVEKHGIGIFVSPNDPASLAAAIDHIASNPRDGEAMGRNARRLAETYYNTARYGRALHDFFAML
jgi:hypothetical protein